MKGIGAFLLSDLRGSAVISFHHRCELQIPGANGQDHSGEGCGDAAQ
jgi:hypothetical protein